VPALDDVQFGGEEYDRLLSESRQMLQSLRAARPAPESDDAEHVGESAKGLVRAVAHGGRLRSVEFNPRVMRMASAELAEHVVTAVNQALDGPAAPAPEAQAPAVDPAALAEQVREVQDQAMRQMSLILQGIRDAVAQAQRGHE
jgi:DNA-binding protein YbaB